MNQFRCDQCKRVHTRSRKCIYCGAPAKYQQAVTFQTTANKECEKHHFKYASHCPRCANEQPAPKVRIKATQLEFPIPSPAADVMTVTQRAGMVSFHERAARAYEASGQAEQAAAARARAESLKAEQVTT